MRGGGRRRAAATPLALARLVVAALPLALGPAPAASAARAPAAPPPAAATPTLDILLRPVPDAAGNVAAVHVRMRFTDADAAASAMAFRAPIVQFNLPGIADRMEAFRVSDARGAVELDREDEPVDETGSGYFRTWRPRRPLELPVTVEYHAAVSPGRLRAGPPFDLRAWAGGVSGGGRGFLALPADERDYRITLRWDVSALAPGAVGVSSLGDGDASVTAPLSALLRSFFMAGPVGRYPATGATPGGFSAVWLGSTDRMALPATMEWAADTYDALRRFFRDPRERAYRLFLRALPEPATSGGTAGFDSFMMQVPVGTGSAAADDAGDEGQGGDGPRGMIAHEMIHGWTGSLDGGEYGPTAWFGEGLTTYYTSYTLLRLGRAPVEHYTRSVNGLARQYYPNPYRNADNRTAADAFWADKNGEVLPYSRGALYFIDVNARILAASGGRRSLDDVTAELFERRRAGERLTTRSWIDAVVAELGPAAEEDFEAIVIRGDRTVVPAPDALGPCFERRTVPMIVPDFGIDRRTPQTRTVVSTVPGSAAARAGLRDGDVITSELDLEALLQAPPHAVSFDVRRDGAPLRVTYTTAPNTVDGYEWARVAGVPEPVCRGA